MDASPGNPKRRPRKPKRLRRAALRLSILGAGLIAMGWMFDLRGWAESRLAYFPTREPFVTPPEAEDVWFETEDDLRLHAWFIPAPGASARSPAPAVLHVHGNAGNISGHAEFSRFLPERGVSVFLFDYRGYGRSDRPKRPLRRTDLLRDAGAALDALLARDDVDGVGVFGVSLGAVVGLALAEQRTEVRSVVSVSAFSSWRVIASHHMGVVGRLLAKPGMDAERNVEALGDRRLMVVHGELDEIVPVSHARALHHAAKGSGVKSRLVISGVAAHNDILIIGREEQNAVASFLIETLGPAPGR